MIVATIQTDSGAIEYHDDKGFISNNQMLVVLANSFKSSYVHATTSQYPGVGLCLYVGDEFEKIGLVTKVIVNPDLPGHDLPEGTVY